MKTDSMITDIWNATTHCPYRLEALKLAYDVAFKTEELNNRQTPAQRLETLKDVIRLAEINVQFIKGIQPTWHE